MAKKIAAGLHFFATFADGRPQWEVVKARGADTWECMIVPTGEDYAGTKKVFGGEEIRAALASQNLWDDIMTGHEGWWKSRELGSIVHYANGFGQFVRGVIVEDEGERKMRPIALVGKWREFDLPRIDAAGNLVESHTVRQIREGATMQPNFTNMVESAGVREGETDPRGQEAIDLRNPEPNGEQAEAKRLNGTRERVLAILKIEYDPATPFSETIRKALKSARAVLAAADI